MSGFLVGVAVIAMFIMFGTLTLRALRPLAMEQRELLVETDYQQIPLLRLAYIHVDDNDK